MIGITTSSTDVPIADVPLAVRYAPTVYDDAITAAGGLAVHLPAVGAGEVGETLQLLDGLLLSGGGDVEPRRYGAAAEAPLDDLDPARDAAEQRLIDAGVEAGTPILGVCRGIQMLNVALGGTLIQDLEAHGIETHHYQHVPTAGPTHRVRIEAGSRLSAAIGRSSIEVNSVHRQAVDGLGAGLVVTARSDDGLVEAIELESADHWVVGVQWHPEAMQAEVELQRRLFAAFVVESGR